MPARWPFEVFLAPTIPPTVLAVFPPFFSAAAAEADAEAMAALADFLRLRIVASPSPKDFSLFPVDDAEEDEGRASELLLGKNDVRP